MKGYTNIPYAKQTADLMHGSEVFGLNFEDKDIWFWVRVLHFESRYWSIDQLLKLTESKNILEFSSGYSLRGLDLCAKDEQVHYIDTDLLEIVSTKQQMIDHLQLNHEAKGRYELLPLNALDPKAFEEVIGRFDPRPITFVNEGLLMYLNDEEKKQLCSLIHKVLKQSGGCWITADIYVKRSPEMAGKMPASKSEIDFMEQHKLEENKFESFEAARAFFLAQGFEFVQEAAHNYEGMSSLPNMIKMLPEEARNSNQKWPKIQATWMLRAK